MTDPARTSNKTSGSGRSFLTRKPFALAAAGVMSAAILGAYAIPDSQTAFAQNPLPGPSVQTPMGQAPLSFSSLVEKVRPAVVSVQVKNGGDRDDDADEEFEFRGMPDLPDGHPLEEFFKRFSRPDSERRAPTMGQGSGFIISADGFVVTNNHVVADADEIKVTMDNGDEYTAEVIGTDERTDIALLKIKSDKQFDYVEFADSTAKVGDWVLAVGNPFGLGGTVTAGIISAHKRDIGSSPYDYLQIDAAVNRGNSGGPAFNLQGKVVGVNTAIFSPSGGNVGIAFAVPADLAKTVVADLKDDGMVSRGWLGVTIQNVTEDIAMSLGLEEAKGAMVTQLSEGGPAKESELAVGDVIVQVNDEEVADSRDLARMIASIDPETSIDVTVMRDGKKKIVPIELGTFPSMKQLAANQSDDDRKPTAGKVAKHFGLSLAPASARRGVGDEGVVIVDVDPGSEAATKGLKAGDVILQVAGIEVSEPKDVAANIESAQKSGRKAVHMLVRSGDRQRFVAIPFA